MSIDQDVLLTILANRETTFRKLQENTKISPSTLRKHLDGLIKRKLVKEEGRSVWKHGKKLRFALTERGKEQCLRNAVENIDASLKAINVIASEKAAKPEELAALREEARYNVQTIVKNAAIPVEEKIRLTQRVRDNYYGSFRKALRNMHMITLKLANPKRVASLVGEVFIHVTEEGLIDIVSEYEILRNTDIQVLSM